MVPIALPVPTLPNLYYEVLIFMTKFYHKLKDSSYAHLAPLYMVHQHFPNTMAIRRWSYVNATTNILTPRKSSSNFDMPAPKVRFLVPDAPGVSKHPFSIWLLHFIDVCWIFSEKKFSFFVSKSRWKWNEEDFDVWGSFQESVEYSCRRATQSVHSSFFG